VLHQYASIINFENNFKPLKPIAGTIAKAIGAGVISMLLDRRVSLPVKL